jgi:hypothetical protein
MENSYDISRFVYVLFRYEWFTLGMTLAFPAFAIFLERKGQLDKKKRNHVFLISSLSMIAVIAAVVLRMTSVELQ